LTPSREANALGALALVLTDQLAGVVTSAAGQSETGAAALSALTQFLDRPSLDRLHAVLGLTPSGTVRLVDRLAEAGLVTRIPGPDARTRSVVLTARGRRVADRISTARAAFLESIIDDLTPAERSALGALLDRLMVAVVARKDGGPWTCRLCDLQACGRAEGHCPAANAAAAKYGRSADA
jgi:DNA-binding MarR family transcriptional regulator